MRIGLISDTHGKLRPEVFDAFAHVDRILHAGDIGSLDLIVELETIAPVHAVQGNTDDFDVRKKYDEVVDVMIEDTRVLVTHGHLLSAARPEVLRESYPFADVIVYGHTHKPLLTHGRPLVVNPGAAGPARFNIKPSVAILELLSLEVHFISL
ncbi:MAG TPA: metallophosphoesterase family protein [Longimicrobiales bacterium]|nr:metallophosphoesterase family protein [Longimicrobiales bacterium]